MVNSNKHPASIARTTSVSKTPDLWTWFGSPSTYTGRGFLFPGVFNGGLPVVSD